MTELTDEMKIAPKATEPLTDLATAPPWLMMWWKFRRHRLAVVSALLVLVLYLIAAFCEFIAPYSLEHRDLKHLSAPPQRIRLLSLTGNPSLPYVYQQVGTRDPITWQMHYQENEYSPTLLGLFVHGDPYKLWGLVPGDVHLFGASGESVYLLGTDSLGRDIFSRICYGARVSLTIGLLGVLISFLLGVIIGGLSGYAGGWTDNLIQRIIEVLRSFPSIPLWLALSAALPMSWSPLQVYLGITVVLSFLTWTTLARQVRGKILSLREEDFVTAAVLSGASRWRVLTKHLLPSLMSHIIVSLTLAIPGMILGETVLSFLGLGLRPPVTSWGVLLKEAQNVQAVAACPWLLTPVLFVILTVLVFNFVGDGLRDAADPYTR